MTFATLASATVFAATLAATLAVGNPAIAAAAEDNTTGTLTVTFTGVEHKEGAIMVALFDEAGWNGGAPVRAEMVDATAATTSVSIAALPAGRYGIKAFHDINGNGTMDTNPFGMPIEPFAFSNDARGEMGPAKWDAAAFDVSATGTVQTITIR